MSTCCLCVQPTSNWMSRNHLIKRLHNNNISRNQCICPCFCVCRQICSTLIVVFSLCVCIVHMWLNVYKFHLWYVHIMDNYVKTNRYNIYCTCIYVPITSLVLALLIWTGSMMCVSWLCIEGTCVHTCTWTLCGSKANCLMYMEKMYIAH